MESHRAQGTLNQLRVALLHGLTFKLFSLYYQIEAIKSELEVCFTLSFFIVQSVMMSQVELDKHQLHNVEIVSNAVMHSPANSKHPSLIHSWMLTSDDSPMVPSVTATPINIHVNESTLPLPATTPEFSRR